MSTTDPNELWRPGTGRVHPSIAHLTPNERDTLAGAIATVDQHLQSATQDRFYELQVREGWIVGCEDCDWNLGVAAQGYPCENCDHVNGDPTTGSTPDDRPMRVCEACMANEHEHCDGGDPHDLEAVFCNCHRLGHPTVTVTKP